MISIHSSAKPETFVCCPEISHLYFNPLQREAGDDCQETGQEMANNFNPLQREAGDSILSASFGSNIDFNPLQREAGDPDI